MSREKYLTAAEWVRGELNRVSPIAVYRSKVEMERVPPAEGEPDDVWIFSFHNEERGLSTELEERTPTVGAIRSEDALLLRELGYPAIPDRLRAYNDYCDLDHDAQGNIVRSLLAAGKTNKVIWEEATFLFEQMKAMHDRGFEHPHYRDIFFEFHHLKPKRFPKLKDPRKDQRTLLIANLVRDVHSIFGIPVWHDSCNYDTVCSSSIVADAWFAHFPNENITARNAKDIY